jgi:hypothetical protein
MPKYDNKQTPVLNYIVPLSRFDGASGKGIRASWLPPLQQPAEYRLFYLDTSGKWRALGKAVAGADHVDIPDFKIGASTPLFMLKTFYAEGEFKSNVAPLTR